MTERIGTIQAEPTTVLLTDRDDSVTVRLRTDSASPVRYRIQLHAPHLSIAEARGEFEGSTELSFAVNTAQLQGKDVPGTIRIFTNLGNVIIDAPIKVGLTGTYQGVLAYDGSELPVGNSQIVLDLVETNGDVTVQVDPERSLAFPASASGPVAGRGIFTFTSGVDFSLKQVLAADFGGSANHFGRSVGRDLRFRLQPSDRGALQGTFEERIHGLFPQPIVLAGTVFLEHKPLERDVTITVPADQTMPTTSATGTPDVAQIFPGWTATTCNPGGACVDASCAAGRDATYHGPLEQKLSAPLPLSTDPLAGPMGDLADSCRQELARTTTAGIVNCALIPPLACALSGVSSAALTSQPATETFSLLHAHTLDPALLVAQDHLVRGLRESFLTGVRAQKTRLDDARNVLVGPATWVLHPSLLD